MTEVEALAIRVLERVSLHGAIQFDDLGLLLPHCTWNQMFVVVDRLSREGMVEISHPDRCTYIVALRGFLRRQNGSSHREVSLPN